MFESAMHLIVLTREQVELAAYRFEKHDNSAVRIARHFRRVDDEGKLRTCRAIRRIERRFEINLGTVCYKLLETESGKTSAIQQQVMEYLAHWRERDDGKSDLVISVDRIREIDRLAQGKTEWMTSLDS
jgi:hypothetical protein